MKIQVDLRIHNEIFKYIINFRTVLSNVQKDLKEYHRRQQNDNI
jgi:hypothetical protein